MDEEERLRINVFDWEKEFPQNFRGPNPGFDAVIGNPPYIRIQALKEWAPLEVEFYKKRYISASKGNYDIYVVFVEKGLSMLNSKGRLGFILPHKFFNAQYGEPLRGLISKGNHLSEVVYFGDKQVFAGATTYTCLMFLEKSSVDKCKISKIEDLIIWRSALQSFIDISSISGPQGLVSGLLPSLSINQGEWTFHVGQGTNLLEKMKKIPSKLSDIAHTFVGTQTSSDEVYVIEGCKQRGKYVIGTSKSLQKEIRVESEIVKPFLRGKQIRRFAYPETDARLICPYNISNDDFKLIPYEYMCKNFPLTLEYLDANKQILADREKGRLKGTNWYAFGYPKSMTLFHQPKIIVPDYKNKASLTFY